MKETEEREMKKKLLTVLLALCMAAASGAVAFADEAAASTATGAEQGVSAAAAGGSEQAIGEGLLIATRDNAVSAAADAEQQDVNAVSAAAASIRSVRPSLTKVSSVRYDKLKLTWERVSGADGYKVYRATSKNGKYKVVKTVKGEENTTYTNTGRTCGKTYYYKIRAYEVKNGKNVYSKYSAVKSGYARPNKVKNVEVNYTPILDTFNLDWDKVSGAKGYQLQVKPASTGKWSTYYKEQLENGKWGKFYPDEWNEDKNIYKYNVKYITLGTEAHWSLMAAEDSYQFRVRAYRTVGGKKVFGLYSEPITIEPAWESAEELVDFVHSWVDENYPSYDRAESEYLWGDATPDNSNWCTDWTYATISQYTTKEYVLKKFLEGTLATYFRSTWGLAEETCGILYTKWLPDTGSWQVWWLS